jgi:hypothetical protein
MSDKPISPLRRRTIEDMTVRNFVEGDAQTTISGTSGHLQPFSVARRIRPRLRIFRLFQLSARHSRAPSPAGSFLGGFLTPATAVSRADVAGRHPKPSTKAVDREFPFKPDPDRFGAKPQAAALAFQSS